MVFIEHNAFGCSCKRYPETDMAKFMFSEIENALDRLHDKGYIGNPKTKAKSVTLTEKGERLSEELFKKHFGLTS